MKYLLVLLGGGMGSLTRYVAGTAIMSRYSGQFPLGTLLINVTGSFLIGLIMTMLMERMQPGSNLQHLLVAGFLGGYTTFSSFEWETYARVREGAAWIGLANVLASVVLGFAAVWLGAMVARR